MNTRLDDKRIGVDAVGIWGMDLPMSNSVIPNPNLPMRPFFRILYTSL